MFERECPYVAPDDKVSLSPTFKLQSNSLMDVRLGIKHPLSTTGRLILAPLVKPTKIGSIITNLNQADIDEKYLYSMLGFLNIIGALIIKLPTHPRPNDKLWRIYCSSKFAAASVRKSFSPIKLAVSLIRASWPLIMAIAVVSILVAEIKNLSFITSFQLAVFSSVNTFFSMYVHEMSHYLALKHIRANTVVDIIQGRLSIRLIHPPLGSNHERLVALCGPMAGAMFVLLVSLLSIRVNMPQIIIQTNLLIAIFHLASLSPTTADGYYIWRNKRS